MWNKNAAVTKCPLNAQLTAYICNNTIIFNQLTMYIITLSVVINLVALSVLVLCTGHLEVLLFIQLSARPWYSVPITKQIE